MTVKEKALRDLLTKAEKKELNQLVSEIHEHRWRYAYDSCCFVLKCEICGKLANAYKYEGERPRQGDRAELLGDGRTIRLIKE